VTWLGTVRRTATIAAWLGVMLVACAGPSPSASGLAWTAVDEGLRSHGQVLTLLFDRTTPGRLLAGLNAQNSLYTSGDGGVAWQPMSVQSSSPLAPWPPPTYALLQSVRSPSVLLAASGGGLYRSADDGASWRAVDAGTRSGAIYSLVQDLSGAFYMGGEGAAVLRSEDDGLTWRTLSPLPSGGAILAVAVSASGDWLLAGTDGAGLFSSRDGGMTWQRVEAVGETFVSAIVPSAGDEPPCDDRGGCILARTRSGLFTTLDGGRTWQKVEAAWDGRVDAAAVGGVQPAWLIATDRGRIYRSVDGRRWAPWGEGLERTGAVFTLAADPASPDRLFAGTENGLYLSDDGGLHWQVPPDGPGTPSADALAMGSDGVLYLANLDGVYASQDQGATWQRRGEGLPRVSMLAVSVAPSAPNVLYAGATGAGLFRSDDRGLKWRATAWNGTSVPGIAVDPADPNRVDFRVAFERVYSSADGGESVVARWSGLSISTEIMSLMIDGRKPGRLFAGGTDALYGSLDGAATWQAIGPELDGQTVFCFQAWDAGPDGLLAGATKGVYVSADAGRSWKPLGEGLEDITVTALALHPLVRERVYAGTKYSGVYRTDDGSRTWSPVGLAGMSVGSLVISPDGRWLFAATPEGVFRTEAR
jgi:photosystem II stability/assembly factor-like uncharacterized protein